MSEAL